MHSKIHISPWEGELAIYHHSKEEQDRPTIIFLHDALGCIETWRNFPKELARITACNYLIYDRLGHGLSDNNSKILKREKGYLEKEADILIRLLQILGINNCILFGHSDGGSIALIAAAKSKHNIVGVITEAAHVFVEHITLEGIRAARHQYIHGNLRDKLLKYHGAKTDELFNAWADTWLNKNFLDWNIEHFLPGISCPLLTIQGVEDTYGSEQQLNKIKKANEANVTIQQLQSTGHVPHREQTDLILKISAEFINKLK